MSLRKLCVFLFVNCIFIFRIANTFVASYAMKYSEIFFVIRKFLAYTPPPPPPQLYMLATALRKRVEFQGDNTAVVSVIMSGTSKDEQLMHLLRALYLVSTRYNFQVTAKHVLGKTNRLADALSRFQ